MHKKFKALLHEYKLEVFHTEHDKKSAEEITGECLDITDEILKDKFHYHFHKLPDANRAEIINMINNYTREAILPAVVEKIVHRQIILEKRIALLENLTERILDNLSVEPANAG